MPVPPPADRARSLSHGSAGGLSASDRPADGYLHSTAQNQSWGSGDCRQGGGWECEGGGDGVLFVWTAVGDG